MDQLWRAAAWQALAAAGLGVGTVWHGELRQTLTMCDVASCGSAW